MKGKELTRGQHRMSEKLLKKEWKGFSQHDCGRVVNTSTDSKEYKWFKCYQSYMWDVDDNTNVDMNNKSEDVKIRMQLNGKCENVEKH